MEHVDRLLAMVGLQDFADYYPAKLSGGMKRRVAVLTAVAPLPSLLLMDEPFSALDEPTRILVHGDIYRLVREFGISTILVTHDLGEAISLSDRVVLLSRAPARAVAQFATPFGRERDLLDIRRTPEFLEFYGKVWGELEQQIKAGRNGMSEPGLVGTEPRAQALVAGTTAGDPVRHRDNWPIQRLVIQIGILVGFLLAWQYLPTIHWVTHNVRWTDRFFISSPTEIAKTLRNLSTGHQTQGVTMWPYLRQTVEATVEGTAIGFFLGAVVGLIFSNSPRLNEVFNPFIILMNSIPRIALIPIFILIAKPTINAEILSIVFVVFFLVFFNALEGGRSVSQSSLDNARLLGAGPIDIMRTIRLPAGAPLDVRLAPERDQLRPDRRRHDRAAGRPARHGQPAAERDPEHRLLLYLRDHRRARGCRAAVVGRRAAHPDARHPLVARPAEAEPPPAHRNRDHSRVPHDPQLAREIRDLAASEPDVTEQKMFGGVAFLVGGNMAIAASGQGGILVRVDPAESEALTASSDASVAEMRGRPMPGWLRVDAETLRSTGELPVWVERGTSYARSLPPKR